MVTIKDIAKLAGVSHGTVSNVLNKRGNVSAKKIRLVEETALKLGYHLNTQAQSLRKGVSDKVYVFIPYQLRFKYQDFYAGLFVRLSGTDNELEIIYFERDNCSKLLDKTLASLPKAIVIVGAVPQRYFLEQLSNNPTQCYVVDCSIDFAHPNCITVTFNYEQFSQDILKYVIKQQVDRVKILSDSKAHDYLLVNLIKKALPKDVDVEPFYTQQDHNLVSLFQLLEQMSKRDLIVSTSLNMVHKYLNIMEWTKSKHQPNLLVICATQFIHKNSLTYYELNYKKCGDLIAKAIEEQTEKAPKCKIIETDGFFSPTPLQQKNNKTLKLLSVKSPMTTAIHQIMGRYQNLTGTKLEITELSYDELQQLLFEDRNFYRQFDLIRIDMAWLQTIATKIFRPFLLNEVSEIEAQLTPNISKEYSFVGDVQYALPFDISVQLLFYRKDLFEDMLIKRHYFEVMRKEMRVPTTFAEFDEIARFFTREVNNLSPVIHGHTLAMKSPAIALCDFMPRLREKMTQYQEDDYEKCWQEALNDYVVAKESSIDNLNQWWGDVALRFAKGEVAMEVLFSNYASAILNARVGVERSTIGAALVPGGHAQIGGGSIGITNTSNNVAEALDFLRWIYSDEISQILTYLGGFISNRKVKSNIDLVELYPWLNIIDEAFTLGNRNKVGKRTVDFDTERNLGKKVIDFFTKQ